MLGASGAISGLLAAYVLYFPRARILTFVVPFFIFTLPAYVFIGYWIALQALNAFLNIGAIGGGVAFFAHVGGFGTGLILALLLRPREHVDPYPGYGGYP
jgi:membrane associated rhomboid family serine protease